MKVEYYRLTDQGTQGTENENHLLKVTVQVSGNTASSS